MVQVKKVLKSKNKNQNLYLFINKKVYKKVFFKKGLSKLLLCVSMRVLNLKKGQE